LLLPTLTFSPKLAVTVFTLIVNIPKTDGARGLKFLEEVVHTSGFIVLQFALLIGAKLSPQLGFEIPKIKV